MKPTDLRGILQYIPQFREKTFILAVDGAIVTDENFATLLLDVAVLRSLNIRVVLVHGASAQIKTLAEEQNLKASNLDGSGITDACHAQNRAYRREPADARNPRRAFGQRPPRRQHQRHHRRIRWASFRAWIICSPARSSAWMLNCSSRCSRKALCRSSRRSVSTATARRIA